MRKALSCLTTAVVLSISHPALALAEEIETIENRVARFSYGLRLLADYEFYDTAVYLLEAGLATSFSDFARYYMAKAYMFLGDLHKARENLLLIRRNFMWYDFVLQSLYYVSFRLGDTALCDRFKEPVAIPQTGVPEFYEFVFLCGERRLAYLVELGDSVGAEKLRDWMKKLLMLYLKSIYSPVDLIPYRRYVKRAFELSMKVFGKPPEDILDQKSKEEIADVLFKVGRYSDAIFWSSDKYKLARAYFASGNYKMASELSAEILPRSKEYDVREKLTYILLISYARMDMRTEFEKLALEYIKNFPNERFSGDLAIKLGVERYVDGNTQDAVKLISYAVSSPFEDVRERARFLLRFTFGHNVKAEPRGFLLLLKSYRDGLSNFRVAREYSIDESYVPSMLAWEIYFLKIYLADSALSQLPTTIVSRVTLSKDDIRFLSQRGFVKLFGIKADERSVFASVIPPPVSFYRELEHASSAFGVPLPLLKAIAFVESRFNPVAVSPANAIGLMQIIPATGKEIFRELGIPFSVELLFDPEMSARAGAYYVRKLKDTFGSWTLAIAAYNAGPSSVSSWLNNFGRYYCSQPEIFIERIPFRQTRLYVMRVLSYYLEYSKYFEHEINLEELFGCRDGSTGTPQVSG